MAPAAFDAEPPDAKVLHTSIKPGVIVPPLASILFESKGTLASGPRSTIFSALITSVPFSMAGRSMVKMRAF